MYALSHRSFTQYQGLLYFSESPCFTHNRSSSFVDRLLDPERLEPYILVYYTVPVQTIQSQSYISIKTRVFMSIPHPWGPKNRISDLRSWFYRFWRSSRLSAFYRIDFQAPWASYCCRCTQLQLLAFAQTLLYWLTTLSLLVEVFLLQPPHITDYKISVIWIYTFRRPGHHVLLK